MNLSPVQPKGVKVVVNGLVGVSLGKDKSERGLRYPETGLEQ